jgi:hypothetical protein
MHDLSEDDLKAMGIERSSDGHIPIERLASTFPDAKTVTEGAATIVWCATSTSLDATGVSIARTAMWVRLRRRRDVGYWGKAIGHRLRSSRKAVEPQRAIDEYSIVPMIDISPTTSRSTTGS